MGTTVRSGRVCILSLLKLASTIPLLLRLAGDIFMDDFAQPLVINKQSGWGAGVNLNRIATTLSNGDYGHTFAGIGGWWVSLCRRLPFPLLRNPSHGALGFRHENGIGSYLTVRLARGRLAPPQWGQSHDSCLSACARPGV